MTTAADIIAALLPRRAAPLLERQTRLPHGWGLWLRGLREKRGGITRERAQALTDTWMARPLPPFPREREHGRVGAFRSLFQQGWEPPLREERGLRRFAALVSAVLHLLFAIAILWLAWIDIEPLPPAGEESRTRLEFVGAGTPEQSGGGPPAASAPVPAASRPPRAATTGGAPAAAAAPPPEPDVAPAVPAQQPLQATEVEQATREFVVPPPTLRPDPVPTLRVPQASVREREVTVVEVPDALPALPRVLPAPNLSAPELQLREREVPAPLGTIRTQALETPIAAVPNRSAPVQQLRERELAMPSAEATAAPSPSAAPGADQAQPSAPAVGAAPATAAAGPVADPRPGALPSPRRADDWGDSTRHTPGQPGAQAGSGLFDAGGRPRIPGDAVGEAEVRPGAPGSRQAQARDDAAANTFLKRVPYAYEPTMFDKDWHPRESLLQEWVRRNIREVELSIPGTSKKVRCVISVLQLGGGCGLFDSNLNDQPAVARPPPEIPKKRNPIKTDS